MKNMNNMNKGLLLLIALIFLFSAITPAMAITGEDEALALKDMGIIAGYEDGDLKLEQTITRAEMCVVLSEMADMQEASDMLKDVASKFSDVKISVWYTGYINLASQEGWVSGYPDGTFRPNANVTNAEALAMILNVLGYGDGELPGSWPTNYMVKATELELLGDMEVVANDAALRGWIFLYAYEALGVELVSWSKTEEAFVGMRENLLDGLSNGSTGEITVVDAYLMVGSELDDDARTVEFRNYSYFEVAATQYAVSAPYVSGEYDVSDGFDIRPYVGIPTDFYLNEDDEIFAVKETREVLSAPLEKVSLGGTFYLDNAEEDVFGGHADGISIINEQLTDWGMEQITGGTLRYVLDDGEDVIFSELIDYDPEDESYVDGDGLVDDVDVDGDMVSISFKNENAELELDTKNDYILVMGAVSALEDIEEYDILTWNEESSDSEYAIYVTRDQVQGVADRFTNDDLRVEGVNHDYAYEVSASYDNGDSFEEKDSSFEGSDFSEEEVTVYLNGVGELYAIVGAIEGGDVAFVTDEVESDLDFGITVYRVDLLLVSGEYVTYYFDDEATPGEGSYKGTFMEYSLNDDEEINFFQSYTAESGDDINYLDADDTRDYDRLVADNDDRYYVTDDSVFVLADPDEDGEYDDAKLLSWTAIQSIGDAAAVSGEVLADLDGDITYGVFYEPLVGDAGDYSVYLDNWSIGTDDFVSFINEAGIQDAEYNEEDLGTFNLDSVVEIKESGDTIHFEPFPGPFFYATVPEDGYNSDRSTLTVLAEGETSETYDMDSDTVVVDLTGDDPVLSSVSQLAEDDLIMVYYDNPDEVLDFIVIHEVLPAFFVEE
jgi:hypothetical protein